MKWTLPSSLDVGGKPWVIHADYRDILDIINRLTDINTDRQIALYVALALFYEDFDVMPENCFEEAIKQMLWFISCGEDDDGTPAHKMIDWEQDYFMIVSGVNKAASCDVRGLKFLHWWTFISYFSEIGEGQLATVVSIREKRHKNKKQEKWEQEFYRENRKKVDFKQKYTKAEDDAISLWTGKAAPS